MRGSSNGRTTVSQAVNAGSIPAPRSSSPPLTNQKERGNILHDGEGRPKWQEPIDLGDTSQVVKRCLEIGNKYLPKESPCIYNRHDIISDFLVGVRKGLAKVRWEIGDPIFFLVRNGLFQVRKNRIRAFNKRLIVHCGTCGQRIDFDDPPCHGSSKTIYAAEVVMPPEAVMALAKNEETQI